MRFGIVGDPVSHSRSPAIHTAGFALRGIQATFDFLPTPAGEFGIVEAMLRSGDLNGVSVTMPHKANAYEAVDIRTDLAERTGSVNTVTARNGELTGTNTDVAGVKFSVAVANAEEGPVLVLGAGGAAAASLVALAGRQIFVSARDGDRASEVLARTGVAGSTVTWGEGVAGSLVVNATPIGMHGGALPDGVLVAASAVLDMAYGAEETDACRYAREHGIGCADGLDMLVGQAIEAFALFTGSEPPIDAFYEAARGPNGVR
jgi:shikimate dehydrogenase